MNNNILKSKKNQVVSPKDEDEIMEKYIHKKKNSLLLTKYIVKHITAKTNDRIKICGDYLAFVTDKDIKKKKLMSHNGCGNRFCPMCAWRKARKDAIKLSVCMKLLSDKNGKIIRKDEVLEEKLPKRFLFLTLTAPNVDGSLLKSEIDKFNYSFKKLMLKEPVKKINKGYIRKLEVTYNSDSNTYHTHFHIVIAVNQSYFKDTKSYINHKSWLDMWREVMGDYTISQVNIKAIADNKAFSDNAIKEIAKYAAKDVDYLKSQNVFDVFYNSLKNRQEITFNGVFKDAIWMYKKGLLNSYMDIDTTEYVYMLLYKWGFGEYVEIEKRELTEEEKSKINKQLIQEIEQEQE